jgi:prophage tail gpP-like protein
MPSDRSSTSSGVASLRAGGSVYAGWKSLRASRSIEQMAGAFSLGVVESFRGGQRVSTPLRPGLAAQLLLDDEPVITGYLDDVNPSYDATSHSIDLAGRDKTADLVDCSAIHKSGQWKNATLKRIALDLLAPFDIDLVIEVDVGKAFPSYGINPGETVFECLDRAARMRALLLTSNAAGALVITRAAKTVIPVVLEEGVNIKSASGQFSWKERFSKYVLRGQDVGNDESHAGDVAHVEATVTDDTVGRYRPLIVIAEDHANATTLRDRAEWERNVRRGRGNRGKLTVQGWRRPDGVLWAPNALVRVKSPRLWLDADMLIAGCDYSLDERGTLTELTIVAPAAFELIAGIGASRLQRKINDKTQKEKKKKSDNWENL